MFKIISRRAYDRLVRKAARADQPAEPRYEAERHAKVMSMLDDLWDEHQPYCPDRPGYGVFGQRWWCRKCRGPWPCQLARLVFKAHGDDVDYTVLRLEIDGEQRGEGVVRYNAGTASVAVPGVQPEPGRQ